MIRRVEIRNYRALRNVCVDLDEFQLVVGPNGAGKSTFFDVLAFIRDILKYGAARATWGDSDFGVEKRAGHPHDPTWMRNGDDVEITITAELPAEVTKRLPGQCTHCRYEIRLGFQEYPEIKTEQLWLCMSPEKQRSSVRNDPLITPAFDDKSKLNFYVTGQDVVKAPRPEHWHPEDLEPVIVRLPDIKSTYYNYETLSAGTMFTFSETASALGNLPEDTERFPVATWFKRFLVEDTKVVVLDGKRLRSECAPGVLFRMSANGANLPWIVRELKASDPERFRDWLDHVRTAIPDLVDIDTYEREDIHHCYLKLKYESGLDAPSWTISEGTLRLLALTILAYTQRTATLSFIEEPENGIHPQALETVFQSLSSVYDKQVFCATHSPIFIGLAQPKQVLCFRKDENGAVSVVRGDQHPRLREWKDAIALGEFFAEGMLS